MDEYRPAYPPLFTANQMTDPVLRAQAVRVRHGVYIEAAHVPSRGREARHFMAMRAAALRMSRPAVFSHFSAAVVWGLPLLGRIPDEVHCSAAGRVGARTRRGIVWHNDRLRDHDVAEVDGVLVTALPRTLLDLARVLPFSAAVALLDHGVRAQLVTPFGVRMPGAEPSELAEDLRAIAGGRGVRHARSVVEFCDPRSASPGESVSRANMHLLGFPPPELQVPFPRADGNGVDVVDFDLPALGTFGEFDGRAKYERAEFTRGRTMADVMWDEKLREQRLRVHRPVCVRWDWKTATDPAALARRLIEFGIHPRSHRRP